MTCVSEFFTGLVKTKQIKWNAVLLYISLYQCLWKKIVSFLVLRSQKGKDVESRLTWSTDRNKLSRSVSVIFILALLLLLWKIVNIVFRKKCLYACDVPSVDLSAEWWR
jgi:hypothetical protein